MSVAKSGFFLLTIAAYLEHFLSVLVSKIPTHTQHINASCPEANVFSGWKMPFASICSPSAYPTTFLLGSTLFIQVWCLLVRQDSSKAELRTDVLCSQASDTEEQVRNWRKQAVRLRYKSRQARSIFLTSGCTPVERNTENHAAPEQRQARILENLAVRKEDFQDEPAHPRGMIYL